MTAARSPVFAASGAERPDENGLAFTSKRRTALDTGTTAGKTFLGRR
jgi:hypothetical protein